MNDISATSNRRAAADVIRAAPRGTITIDYDYLSRSFLQILIPFANYPLCLPPPRPAMPTKLYTSFIHYT